MLMETRKLKQHEVGKIKTWIICNSTVICNEISQWA